MIARKAADRFQERVRERLIGASDQRAGTREMMIDESRGYSGHGTDAPHGDPCMTVTPQALQRRFDQRLATCSRRHTPVLGADASAGPRATQCSGSSSRYWRPLLAC